MQRAVADGAPVRPRRRAERRAQRATGGLYYRPTVFEGVDRTARSLPGGLRPGAHAADVRHRGRGRALANDTEFGLAATLVTGDPERAERVAARLRAGTVWVNCFFVRDLAAPFGGSGHSGIGREGGTW